MTINWYPIPWLPALWNPATWEYVPWEGGTTCTHWYPTLIGGTNLPMTPTQGREA